MNKIIEEQLKLLSKALVFQVDGIPSKEIPESFSKITFEKSDKNLDNLIIDKTFIFENYMMEISEKFDFHIKFNNSVPPPSQVMCGSVLKETEKMYYVSLHTFDGKKSWIGWTPKKSVRIEM